MKHLFVVNPVAGGVDRTEEIRALALRAFEANSSCFEIYTTRAPGDATAEILRRASAGESLHVYSCGGDGTFNECISAAVHRDNIAVCPFPLGTGNDFCRMFGEEQALFRDINAAINGEEHPIDVIDCNGRYSVNICSVGIDARIGTNVHKYTSFPLFRGAIGYVVSALVEMCRGISQHMIIRTAGQIFDGKFTLACACNGRYYGGGFNPTPAAMPDDGVLDILIVKKANLFQFALMIGKYAKGRGDEIRKFITHIRTDEISIEFDEENVVNLDGEAFFTKKACMKLLPGAVKLIVPMGMTYFTKQ